MEDISRELEKEIAQSKPKPYKKDKETRVLIVDDFGQIKSGEYLKYLLRVLLIFSIVCFVAAGIFFKLHSDGSKDIRLTKQRLILAEKKVEDLTKEKEVLMARLVIFGKEPTTDTGSQIIDSEPQKDEAAINGKDQNKKILEIKKQKIAVVPPQIKKSDPVVAAAIKMKKKTLIAPELNTTNGLMNMETQTQNPLQKSLMKKDMVSIEKFTVKKDGVSGDLLVRFDIRNTSKGPGDVSGRIFTVLKPDNKPEDQWLVVPSAPLGNGIPSEFRKGQYFSIAHFKPVKFRIKNTAGPDFFQKASIYIFNNQGEIIFEKLIEIDETDKAQ